MAGPMERLAALENVEKEIISCLQSAGKKNKANFRLNCQLNPNYLPYLP